MKTNYCLRVTNKLAFFYNLRNPLNRWICTRKEPFIKQQYLRAVTKKQTFVTKSNSMKKHDLTIVFFSCPKGGSSHAGYEITKLFLRRRGDAVYLLPHLLMCDRLHLRSWKFPLSDNSAGRQHSLLSPLDCPTTKPDGVVNGGRSPFILTVD